MCLYDRHGVIVKTNEAKWRSVCSCFATAFTVGAPEWAVNSPCRRWKRPEIPGFIFCCAPLLQIFLSISEGMKVKGMRCLEVSRLWGPWEVASNITAAGSAKAVRWGKDGCLFYPGSWFYKTKSAL